MSASEVTGGESETTINVGSDTNLTMDSPTEATLNSSKGEEGSKEVFVDALDTFKGVYVNKGFDSIELDEKVKHGVEGNNNNNSNNNGVNGTSGPLKPTTFMPTIGSKSTKSLVWNNLSFEVVKRSWTLKGCQVKREVTLKQILKPQNGEIVAGTLTALMGPSGAGKSTLLNCLIGHYVTGVKGEVYVTCAGPKPKAAIAFVPQRDDLFPTFTVRETLLFSSKLKNTKAKFDHEEQTSKVMKWLNLTSCANVKVSRCSGGQVKRVCIGVELISNPDILVLDEPTTGLDSSTAAQCVRLLRKLTESNENPPAIVATIHQPNYKIFNEFHKVYLLSRNGQCIYFGSPLTIVDYFGKFNLTCPSYCNPADYAIEVAYGDYGQECFQKMEENNRLVDYHNVDRGMKFDLKKVTDKARKKKLPFWRHTQLLLARNWANVFRDSNQFWYRNLQGVAIAFLVSFLWVYEVGENDACWSNFESAVNKTELKDNLFKINITATKDEYLTKISRIADNSAFIFANCIYIMMTSLMSCVLAFPMEAHIVVKEVSNNWYKILPYYLAKTVADFPNMILSTILMGGIAYPMTGQIPVYWRFFAYLGISCLVGEICQTLGMFIGTMLSTDVVSAALLTMASTLPAMLFAGFLVRFSGMPWYFRPLSYFSYLRYAFEAILVIIYGFDRCKPTDGPNFIDELVNSQNPTTLAKNLLEEFNITRRDIFRFSNLLNVDDMCLESVVNGSKAYLGVGDFDYSADSIDYSTDGPFDEIELTPQQLQPSYIMSYYEIKDDAIYFDVYMLFVMLFVLKFAVYLLLQYKTKATK